MTYMTWMPTRLKTVAGALALSMFVGVGAAEAADHATGGYVGLDYTYGAMGDVSAEYRGTTSASYELDDADDSGSLSFGYDWGNVRAEIKVTYAEGDISNVDSASARSGSKYNYGLVTVGALYDFDDITLHEEISLTPFVGAGVGYDGGYMNAQKDTESNCPALDCAGGDDRSDYAFAVRGSVGLALNLHKNFSLTTSYEYVDGMATSHLANAGVRLNF